MIVLSKLTLEELVELGAEHFSMRTPSDSIYNVGTAAEFLRRKAEEKIRQDGSIIDANKLVSSIDDVVTDTIQNAIGHGNQLKPNKQIHAYFLWQEHESGNALLYMVVRDEGEGFDVDNPIARNPRFGNEGLAWTKDVMDFVYNFNDPAVYMVKVIRRQYASPEKIVKVETPLTQNRLGEEEYHGHVTYMPHKHLATVHVFDLHALMDLGELRDDFIVAKENATLDFDPYSTLEGQLIARPYLSVDVPAHTLANFTERAKLGGLQLPIAMQSTSRRPPTIHTNSLFHSIGTEQSVYLSYGLSLRFLRIGSKLIEFYQQLPKRSL